MVRLLVDHFEEMLEKMNTQGMAFKDVFDIIQLLSREVKNVLKDQFIGIYVHGSLAVGDFDPERSDIDFLVVTKDMVSKDLFFSLEKMHDRIATDGNEWTKKLEGSYVPKELLRSNKPPAKARPHINGGNFCLAHFGYEWVLELYTIREFGIVIEGPNPNTLIDSISSREIQQASLKILNEWWSPMLSNSSRLKDSEYQAYAILTMCRTLYMFTHGTLVSKKNAAEWAQSMFKERWEMLIGKALKWKRGLPFENIEETLEFIRFTLSYINNSNGNRMRTI